MTLQILDRGRNGLVKPDSDVGAVPVAASCTRPPFSLPRPFPFRRAACQQSPFGTEHFLSSIEGLTRHSGLTETCG